MLHEKLFLFKYNIYLISPIIRKKGEVSQKRYLFLIINHVCSVLIISPTYNKNIDQKHFDRIIFDGVDVIIDSATLIVVSRYLSLIDISWMLSLQQFLLHYYATAGSHS